MNELLPDVFLVGMAEPRRWVEQIAVALTPQSPCAPPRWGQWRTGRPYLQWYERLGTGETLTIALTLHTTCVELSVWTSGWEDRGQETLGYWEYYTLVLTVATTSVDQYCDPDGPGIQVQVQFYREAQEW